MSNKRVIKSSLTFIIITIYTLLFIYNIYMLNIIRFNEVVVDENTYYSILENKNEYEGDMLDKVFFNGNELFDVANTNEFFYSMVVNDNHKYNPYITYKSNTNDTKIVLLSNYITDELIANNDHIRLLAYNDYFYKEYEIVVTTLPIMNISYEDNEENRKKYNITLEDIDEDNNEYNISSKVYLYDNQLNNANNSDVLFHVRGKSSLTFPKKNIKLNYSNNINIFGMGNSKDWILYSAYEDIEKIRNVFSSKLWYDCCSIHNEANVRVGNYYKYIELFINGEYRGLYAIGQSMNRKNLNIKDDDYLYKKSSWLIESEDINSLSNAYEIKTKNTSIDPLYDYFNSINSSNREYIISSIDIGNQIDFFIFNNFSQNVDGGLYYDSHNLYILLSKSNQKYKGIYIPWDLEYTFGDLWNVDDYYDYAFDDKLKTNIIFKSSPIYKLITDMDDKDIIAKVKERYYELRRTSFSEKNILDILSLYEKNIFYSGAYRRDAAVFLNGSCRYYDNTYRIKDYNCNYLYDDLTIFKKYVLERLKYMDDYINDI